LNANPTAIQPPQAPPRALYFDSGANRLFGWYHRSNGTESNGLGVVICNPFGYESICGHRGMRAFAEELADAGFPVLRFDYTGTGDSSDHDPDADQLPIWTQDVVAAVDELRRISNVRRVFLLGFRVGAMLAVLAAKRCNAVGGLALIAPISNGKRYVRELKTLRRAASMGDEHSGSATPSHDPGGMEVSGFRYSAATISSLSQVALGAQDIPPSAEMLIIDGTAMPMARDWAANLATDAVRVRYANAPGLVEMLMTAPHFAAVPSEMIAITRDWLQGARSEAVGPGDDGPAAREQPAGTAAPEDSLADLGAITERPMFLPSEVQLFAIVTEPKQDRPRKGAVVLINAGADYHIGASGMNVALARRWARDGYVVLRMDLAGIGDSSTRSGRPNDEVFPPRALDDIRVALEWLRSSCGIQDMALVGLCSGAYHTLQAAIGGLVVRRAMMVNPETFFWSDDMSIYDRQTAELVRQPAAYRGKLLSRATWTRLFTGQIDVRYILGTLFGRLSLLAGSRCRDIARWLKFPLSNDLGLQLEKAAAQGVQLVFVFARGEPGIELLKLQAGSSLGRLRRCLRIHIVDHADHVFSRLSSRRALDEILSEELVAQPVP